jgi:hypothetical protein
MQNASLIADFEDAILLVLPRSLTDYSCYSTSISLSHKLCSIEVSYSVDLYG